MKRKKLALLVSTAMILSMFFTSCGAKKVTVKNSKAKTTSQFIKASDPSKSPASAKNRKDTFIMGSGTPGGNFVNCYAHTMTDVYIGDSIFDGLTDIDQNGTPIHGVAKSWDISKDGLTYTFHLRDDVKFSDGTPLTADDVKFTFEVLADPSFSGAWDASSFGIKGYDDFNKGKTKDLEGVKVIDPHTVSITLDHPNSSLLYQIREVILPKEYFGKDYVPGNTKSVEAKLQNPVGCGPYKMAKYVPGQEVDLTANENYWKGAPKIKNIIFKATNDTNGMQNLISGATDADTFKATPENISQLKEAGFLNITISPAADYSYVGVNCKDPKFSDVKVRQALTYGLNRKQLIQTVYKGQAFLASEPQSIINPSYLKNVNQYNFNTAKANKLLDEAGWKKGSDGIREKDGVKFKINLICSSTNDANQIIIPIMKADYKLLGIDVVPQLMDLNTVLSKMKEKKFDAYLMGTSIGSDVMSDLAGLKSDSPYNYNQYSNSEVDKLVDDGIKETDNAKRIAIEQKIYKILNEELPNIYTYQPEVMYAYNSRVSGVDFLPYKNFPYSFYKAQIK